jgi:hypothetical protein
LLICRVSEASLDTGSNNKQLLVTGAMSSLTVACALSTDVSLLFSLFPKSNKILAQLRNFFCYSCSKRTRPRVKSAHVSVVGSNWCWLSALATSYSRPISARVVEDESFLLRARFLACYSTIYSSPKHVSTLLGRSNVSCTSACGGIRKPSALLLHRKPVAETASKPKRRLET